MQNLFRHYRTFDISTACATIERWALGGDLILGGHVDFTFLRGHIDRPMKIITLFREPGARCRSEYDYCRAGYREKSTLSRLDTTIKHRMAAKYSFEGYLDFLLDHADSYGNLAARYVGWDGRERLANFFERCVFHSGVLERGDLFARGLAAKMEIPLHFPHQNRTAATATALHAAQRAKIEQLYPRDFLLYEWQSAACEVDAEEIRGRSHHGAETAPFDRNPEPTSSWTADAWLAAASPPYDSRTASA